MVGQLMLMAAFILLLVHAFYETWPRPALGWLGLALFMLSLLLAKVSGL